ncbi:7-cyano-7-deazaguanine synthase [Rhodovulum sp. DZ06]|uniref:7-cyano-7-deazaguanine synthase n=1 Tax=Rhodovulum sp. DZ06 TaxID=3425126 RepID=UPI003D3386AB
MPTEPAEVLIRGDRAAPSGAKRRLLLDVNGREAFATLDPGLLARAEVEASDHVRDLLEIAAWIYAADAMLPRGDATDPGLGRGWRRRMRFVLPVRDPAFWNRPEVAAKLEAIIALISEDQCRFEFEEGRAPAPVQEPMPGLEGGFAPDAALLFSGGLDSLAGALEETLSQNRRVLLVSARSATKVQKVQDTLVRALRSQVGEGRLLHAPVGLNVKEGETRESTHRTRSLFFAAAAACLAQAHGIGAVRFYENGVVSMNLPPSGQVIGTRATRSTHPQALAMFGDLLTLALGRPMPVENPFFWKTKTDVVTLIRDLGAEDLIRATRSCADVRNMTRAHSHCGLCSQCIDRRFAMLAAGLDAADPEEAYEVDPLLGPRRTLPDREIALGYARNAETFATKTPGAFIARFGETARATAWLHGPADVVGQRLFEMHRRHGVAVSGVAQKALSRVMTGEVEADPESLIAMLGQARLSGATSEPRRIEPEAAPNAETFELRIGPSTKQVEIAGLGTVVNTSAAILRFFAQRHLEAMGQGLEPEDHPLIAAGTLETEWGVEAATVRRRINRLRADIAALAIKRGLAPPAEGDVLENLPWRGYRLNPDRVRVVMRAQSSRT